MFFTRLDSPLGTQHPFIYFAKEGNYPLTLIIWNSSVFTKVIMQGDSYSDPGKGM